MKDLTGGPFRSVELAAEPPAPERFLVRRDDNELVIEGRWPIEALRGSMLLFPLFVGGSIVAALTSHAPLGYMFVALAAGMAVNWATSVGRTTLTLRPTGCAIKYSTPFGTRNLAGSTDSLDIIGIREIALRDEKRKGEEALGIFLSLGGEEATVFRNVPRAELEWVLAQVRAWREQIAERPGEPGR